MSVDDAKRLAGYTAIDNHVQSGMRVGIGSGSTVVFAVERLAEKIQDGTLADILAICTSFQTTLLCREKGIQVTTLDDPRVDGVLDVAIDGADEFDPDLNLIKGGGGAHTQEKIVDSAAKIFVVIVDEKKQSGALGEKWAVPIEVIPAGLRPVMKALETLGAEPVLRMGEKVKAGPVISDNGNFIVDAKFGVIEDPARLDEQLNRIPGIVDHGLFVNMASVLYMGRSDGTIETFERE
jgi:ribose 5-phosphate isomerase A